MKPISKFNFGPESDRLRISFVDHTGTVVTGHILTQMGLKTFNVTADDENTFIVELAQTVDETNPVSGSNATILCHPFGSSSPEHVKEIWSKVLVTVEGNRYAWSRVSSATAGTALIDTNGAP